MLSERELAMGEVWSRGIYARSTSKQDEANQLELLHKALSHMSDEEFFNDCCCEGDEINDGV